MSTSRRLDAVFFRLESGSEPVREWLKSLPKDERKAIGEDIAYVQFKWPIGKPRRSPTRRRLGDSHVAGQSNRADALRGRGPADGAATWVHQEDTADTE